jgi:hypothetical protein
MSKKTNQKKKVNIKLGHNQSFIIEDLDILLHIQKTYANFLRGNCSEQEKNIYKKIVEAVNISIENVYISLTDGVDDEW